MNKKNLIALSCLAALIVSLGGFGFAAACGEDEGMITIDKKTYPAADPQAFNFAITGANGSANLSVADADAPKTADLKVGTYSVVETVPAGWDQTSVACKTACGATVDPSNISLQKRERVTCTFTNTKKGHLIVQKTTDPAADVTAFGITASGNGTITGGGAGTVTDATDMNYEVTPGTYAVAETPLTGWEITGNTCTSVVVGAGETKTCVITNKKSTGTLIVKKVVVNDNGGTKVAQDFTFQVNGATAVAFEADGQNDLTVDAGSYDVTEPAVTGYATTYSNCDDVVVAAGGTATCVITNNDIQPKLTVIKDVVNGPKVVADFPLFVNQTAVTSGVQKGFDAGQYTISETNAFPTIYDDVKIDGDCAADGKITLNAGDVKTCTIHNKDAKAVKLIVIKHVINDNGGTKAAGDFSINVTGANVLNPTFAGSETGTEVTLDAEAAYNVTETAVAGYTATYSADCTGTYQIGGATRTCTITNNDDAVSLTLIKKVNCGVTTKCGNNNCAKTSEWTLTATGTGETATNLSGVTPVASGTGFKADTYVLGETGPDGYTGVWTCVGATVADNMITLVAGQSATCTLTNTKDIVPPSTVGKIKVVKYSIGGNSTTFNFTAAGLPNFSITPSASFWGKMLKGSWTSGDLAAGTKYTVTETVPVGWKQVVNTCKNVKIKAGKTVTCMVINKKIVDKPACNPKPTCGNWTNCNDRNHCNDKPKCDLLARR